jgi:hypothetical protein
MAVRAAERHVERRLVALDRRLLGEDRVRAEPQNLPDAGVYGRRLRAILGARSEQALPENERPPKK